MGRGDSVLNRAPVLVVRGLQTHLTTARGVIRAVDDVSFAIRPGEVLGLVGESGSGKSMTALSIMRLVPNPPARIIGGEVMLEGRNLLALSEAEMQKVRGHQVAMVFQDPMSSLNPTMKVGAQIMEAMEVHLGLGRAAARQRAIALFRTVGIPLAEKRIDQYAFEFSGGMRQRAMIALALSCEPKLLIADEPTTALDVTIQAEIVSLVKQLARERNMGVLWITHDLGIVAGLCHRVAVMYAGRLVELAGRRDLFTEPRHPYTLGLLGSVPGLERHDDRHLTAIPGSPPDLARLPPGCPFYPRCAYHTDRCLAEMPLLRDAAPGHAVACWQADATVKERDRSSSVDGQAGVAHPVNLARESS
jgi:oligopeptide/dipeptide ABC transporter ATP-binding protein